MEKECRKQTGPADIEKSEEPNSSQKKVVILEYIKDPKTGSTRNSCILRRSFLLAEEISDSAQAGCTHMPRGMSGYKKGEKDVAWCLGVTDGSGFFLDRLSSRTLRNA